MLKTIFYTVRTIFVFSTLAFSKLFPIDITIFQIPNAENIINTPITYGTNVSLIFAF